MSELLVDRIKAALDEEERVAKQAAWSVADHTYAPIDVDDQKVESNGHWTARGVLGVHKRVAVEDPGWDPKVTDVVWSEVGDHIARHDPARVLRQVTAMRKILDEHELTITKQQLDPYDPSTGTPSAVLFDVECSTCGWATENPASGCPTVLALAEALGIEVS